MFKIDIKEKPIEWINIFLLVHNQDGCCIAKQEGRYSIFVNIFTKKKQIKCQNYKICQFCDLYLFD